MRLPALDRRGQQAEVTGNRPQSCPSILVAGEGSLKTHQPFRIHPSLPIRAPLRFSAA